MRAFVWFLFTTFVALALGAVFQEPLRDAFTNDRLRATFITGPWVPYPSDDGQLDYPPALAFPERAQDLMTKNNIFAAVHISNDGRAEVENASMKFGDLFTPDVYVPPSGKRPGQYLPAAQSLQIPTLKPGEEVRLYFWKNNDLPWSYYFGDIKSYSSEGPFRLSVAHGNEQGSLDRGTWLDWLDDATYIVGVLLLIMLVFVLTSLESYYRQLLGDEDFYLDERVRFESDAKKFVPGSKAP